MRIDLTKLKKSYSEVPADCGWLIDKLRSCSNEELLEVLHSYHSWSYGKCELYHWTHVLDRFDSILEQASTRHQPSQQSSTAGRTQESWVLECDLPNNSQLQELVVWVLNFTTLLVEHSFSRHLYSSVDHLVTLLSSSSMTIVLAVLNLLYMFSKRSNFISRLGLPRQALLSRLTHLAESWGGKENGFDLAHCCKPLPLPSYPDSATTLHFEAYSGSGDASSRAEASGGSSKPYAATMPVQITSVHLLARDKTPSKIMDDILQQYRVPQDKQMAVFTHLRLACNFATYETRLQCVQARLQALSVLVYCNALQDNANTMLYSGLLDEFVAVLELRDPALTEIKAATLRTLTSIIHLERMPNFPKLSTIMDVTGASSYHGFLPVLVRSCITSLTSMGGSTAATTPTSSSEAGPSSGASTAAASLYPAARSCTSSNSARDAQPAAAGVDGVDQQLFPAPLATALFSFLYHLASYEAGGEALVACGMMEALLSVVNWRTTEPDHITFVTRAVRVIDLITNLDMQAFQVHGGLAAFVNRLELEVTECCKEQPFVINPPNLPAEDVVDREANASPVPMDTDNAGESVNSGASSASVSPPDASVLNLGPDDEDRDDQAAELVPAVIDDASSDMQAVAAASEATADVSMPSTSDDRGAFSTGDNNKDPGGKATDPLRPDYSAAKTNLTCLAQRAALLKSMLNFLKKAIQDTAFSDSMRHLMEASLPSSLRHIISNAEYYGPSLFLLATDVVTVYVFGEPSFLSSLQDNGLTNVVLHALLIKDVPATREVLSSLPNVFSALCLNSRGLQAFVACRPFERLFKVLLSPDYLLAMRRRRSADPMGDTASNLGNAMDELMRHQPSLKTEAMKAIVKLLDEVCHLGRDSQYVCWKTPPKHEPSPMPSARSLERETNDNSSDEEEYEEEGGDVVAVDTAPSSGGGVLQGENIIGGDGLSATITGGGDNAAADAATTSESATAVEGDAAEASNSSSEKRPVPLVDYILNVMKFVDAILSNNATDDHCKEFVQQLGLSPLLEILGLPNLPMDFPSSQACQSVSSVCKSILNLAHESGVVKCGLECLDEHLKTLAPFTENRSPESLLLQELQRALQTSGVGGCAALNTASDPVLNARLTPLLHSITAVHAYVVMLVHVCRTSQTDIRQVSVSQWGSEVGLRVLAGLSALYQTLVWESTILINKNAEGEKLAAAAAATKDGKTSVDGVEIVEMEVESVVSIAPSEGAAPLLVSSTAETKIESVTEEATATADLSPEQYLKLTKQLLSSASRLGKSLAELFTLLVKLCVGSPLRQRRGQNLPPTPTAPSQAGRTVAESLARLLHSLLDWAAPAAQQAVSAPQQPLLPSSRMGILDELLARLEGGGSRPGLPGLEETVPVESGDEVVVAAQPPHLTKLHFTFMICSLRFTNPMLFDDKKMPYHLMMHYFFNCHGLNAFFKTFEWALDKSEDHFGGKTVTDKAEADDVGETVLEYLENWCGLLERLVNPKNMLESPHALPAKTYPVGSLNFGPLQFLIHTQKVAFEAVLKIWDKSPVSNFSLSITEIVLSILCSILKAETIIQEKLTKEKQPSPVNNASVGNSATNFNFGLGPSSVMVAAAPTSNALASSAHHPAAFSAPPPSSGHNMAVAPAAGTSPSDLNAGASGPLGPVDASADTSGSSNAVLARDAAAAAGGAAPSAQDANDDDENDDELEIPVNRQYLQALMDMGFPEQRCLQAIAQTNSVEQATEFLLMSPANDHLGLGMLGGDGDAGDMDLSEDAQMMQAIAMSLAADVTPAANEDLAADAASSSSSSAAPAADGTAEPTGQATSEDARGASGSAVDASSMSEPATTVDTNIITTTAGESATSSTTITVSTNNTTSNSAVVVVTTASAAAAAASAPPVLGRSSSAGHPDSNSTSSMVDTAQMQIPSTSSGRLFRNSFSRLPPPKLNDTPLEKERLDEFTNNILDGCLRQLDCQGQIVYKVCDLLTTCSKRNGSTWLHGMLNTLVAEINSQSLKLQEIAATAQSAEDVKNLWASELANKFAIRLHLITLLLEEVRDSCTQQIDCEMLISNLSVLLCDTEAAMSNFPRPISGVNCTNSSSQNTAGVAGVGAGDSTATEKPTSSSTSVSMLLMPLNLTPNESPVVDKNASAMNKDKNESGVAYCTPKWIAPAMLFIDLYEKIFLAARKRMALLKKHKRVWKCFDANYHKWIPYATANNKIIDDAYFAGESTVRIVNARRKYIIQFQSLVQINEESGNRRPVMVTWDEEALPKGGKVAVIKTSSAPAAPLGGQGTSSSEGGTPTADGGSLSSPTAAERTSSAFNVPPPTTFDDTSTAMDVLPISVHRNTDSQGDSGLAAPSLLAEGERRDGSLETTLAALTGAVMDLHNMDYEQDSSAAAGTTTVASGSVTPTNTAADEKMDVDDSSAVADTQEAKDNEFCDPSEELPEYIAADLMKVCVGFLQLGVDTDTLHAVLRLSLRLTRSWQRAAQFERLGGIKALLALDDSHAFKGFSNLAALLMRHVLEEPHTLTAAMEKVIRGTVGSGPNPNGSGRELHYLLRLLAPASCRGHATLCKLAQDMLRIEYVKRPMAQQVNNEDIIFCQLAVGNKSTSSSSSSASPEAQSVIKDLLDALTIPSEEETAPADSAAASTEIASDKPCNVSGTAANATSSARRHLNLSRSSSANDMVVHDPDDQSPMDSDAGGKLPETDAQQKAGVAAVTKARRPLLSRWNICKLLAEFVRCYPDVAKLVTEHVYTPDNTEYITQECSALSYMLDSLVCGAASSGNPPTTEDGRGYVRLLVGALASCNHAPEAQAILVTEVKASLARCCQTTESNTKHEQLQSLIHLICTMMETCPSHYSSPASVFGSKNTVSMNNIMRILVRKGVVTDLARIPHCLDLSSPNLAGTVNASLKALEMVARVMNHPALIPAASARKKQGTVGQATQASGSSATAAGSSAGGSGTAAGGGNGGTSATAVATDSAGHAAAESAGAGEGVIERAAAVAGDEEDEDDEEEEVEEVVHDNEDAHQRAEEEDEASRRRHEASGTRTHLLADAEGELDAIFNRIIDNRRLDGDGDESGGEGGDDDDHGDDDDDRDRRGGSTLATLAFVISDTPMDTDETLHDSRMVTHSESQLFDDDDHDDGNDDGDSSSSSESSDDEDDDNDDDDDGDNEDNEDVVHDDNDADGDDDEDDEEMDDGSVIDEEEEEEEEEEEDELELFDDSYLRLPIDRDSEDMVLLPSYQHYIDTIDTIDTMIFGNRVSVPGHGLPTHDEQAFVTLTTPSTSNGGDGSGIPTHPLFQNPRDGNQGGAGGGAGSSGGAGGGANGAGGAGGPGGRGATTRGSRSRGLLRYQTHTPRYHTATASLLQRLLGRSPADVLDLSSNFRDATQVWFTNQDVRIIQPDSDPLLGQASSLLAGTGRNTDFSTITSSLSRWAEEARVLQADAIHDTIIRVKTPLLEVLEKRRASEQAERDRKKKEQEAAATAAATAAAAASAKESSSSASATTTPASDTVVADRPPVLQGSQSDSLPAFVHNRLLEAREVSLAAEYMPPPATGEDAGAATPDPSSNSSSATSPTGDHPPPPPPPPPAATTGSSATTSASATGFSSVAETVSAAPGTETYFSNDAQGVSTNATSAVTSDAAGDVGSVVTVETTPTSTATLNDPATVVASSALSSSSAVTETALAASAEGASGGDSSGMSYASLIISFPDGSETPSAASSSTNASATGDHFSAMEGVFASPAVPPLPATATEGATASQTMRDGLESLAAATVETTMQAASQQLGEQQQQGSSADQQPADEAMFVSPPVSPTPVAAAAASDVGQLQSLTSDSAGTVMQQNGEQSSPLEGNLSEDLSALAAANSIVSAAPTLEAVADGAAQNGASESTPGEVARAAASGEPAAAAAAPPPGIIYARDTEYADILGDIEIPEGVDPSFLAALPEDMRQEVIAEHLRLQRLRNRTSDPGASTSSGAGGAPTQQPAGEVSPEFLAALPPSIQEEVLAQQRVQQAATARSNPDEPVDAAQFLEALPPSLRQTILTDLDNSQFSALPPDLAQEAQTLRRQREERVRHAHDHLLQGGGGGGGGGGGSGRGHTLSHILRNTARLGSRLMQSSSWSTSWNLQPSTAASASTSAQQNLVQGKTRGRQLLDHEALSCLLVLLFLDEAKLNTARLHRVLRHLCNHPPTRQWIIRTLLSIMEKCHELQQQTSCSSSTSSSFPGPSRLTITEASNMDCSTPDQSKGAIRKGSKHTSSSTNTGGTSSFASSTPVSSAASNSNQSLALMATPTSSRQQQSPNTAWLSMSIDAALGCRANIFQIVRPPQTGKKSSSTQPSAVSVTIHPQAAPLVCKHALDAMIALAKNFTVHFLPYRKKSIEDVSSGLNTRAESAIKPVSSGSSSKDAGAESNSKEDAVASTSKSIASKALEPSDFWDLLVKLDTINVCKKGKGLARSHSCSGTSSTDEEHHNLPLEYSPLGQLLEQLAHPVVRRSSLLTDKLLRLLALVSAGLSSPNNSISLSQQKHNYTTENLEALERLFALAIQVLTSKSCSEEGLEDATAILVNLSQCPPPARTLVLRLLLRGVATLGSTVASHINALLLDLQQHAQKTAQDHQQQPEPTSKGTLKDRFTQKEVVIVGRSGSRNKPSGAGSELQLASMSALTSKTSSQAFFLRTLKVIVQLRDASALRKAKRRPVAAAATVPVVGAVQGLGAAPAGPPAEGVAVSAEGAAAVAAGSSSSGDQGDQPSQLELTPATAAVPLASTAGDAVEQMDATTTEPSSADANDQSSRGDAGASRFQQSVVEAADALSAAAEDLSEAVDAMSAVSAEALSAAAAVHATSNSLLGYLLRVSETPSTSTSTSAATAAGGASGPSSSATAADPEGTLNSDDPQVPDVAEEMEIDDQDDDEPELKSLSQELNLDELWQALSSCLDELAESPDTHAVLVLQPAVEAFFLVHATAAATSAAAGAAAAAAAGAAVRGANARVAAVGGLGAAAARQESRENHLAHLNDLAPMSPLPAVMSPLNTSELSNKDDGDTSDREESSESSSTMSDSEKFLRFAERHRSVLNQILRQSTVHLADGPFSVLVDHIRLLDFDIKRKYFRTELERADDGVRREDLTVHVRRDHVFEDSFRELHRRTSDDWKNRFYIVYEGEEGQDAGGLLREWYMIISREIFNPMYALFCISPGDRVTYMINSSSHCNSNHLSYFKFVGRVIAKAVYDNKLLECYFTRSFYKHILGKMVRFTDMESEDYSFYQGLVYLMDHNVATLGYELTFSTEVQEFGVREVRELKPNGEKIAVTEENKMEYVKLVCQMKMTGAIRKQLNSFLEGFYDIIPKRLISIFNEQELELLISGLPNIDIDDLRANTEYHKYQPNSLQIQWFWRALRGFDQAERAKFLQFVTGTSKVPLQGFAALEGMNGTQKFQIHRDDRATDRLPSAHTCFNQLDLPVYETYDKLRHYLLKAVHECSEGFGFA